MLNAANEIAVDLFLQNRINFLDIYKIIESSFEKTENLPMDNINDIFNVDFLYRKKLNEYIKKSVLKD
jgi:1-deoxy-D-xylulose-5-phosphate reductoisomerase